MKKALAKEEVRIRKVLFDEFCVDARQLEFVPIGESSWLYKATDREGKLYAVKVQKEKNSSVDEVRRLLSQSQYAYAPAVYLTKDGNAQAVEDGFSVLVEDYIKHDNIKAHNATPKTDYLITLGKALRDLHSIAITSTNVVSQIPVETFRSCYFLRAKESLSRFMEWSVGKPEAQKLRRVIEMNTDKIDILFARSIELGQRLATKRPKLMLTHGDVHFGNILETKDGRLFLIDWDLAMLGGIGHDLMYFSDEQIVDISIGYGSDLLQDQENIWYYRNHLMLRFIWFWLNKARYSTSDQELYSVTETIETTFDNSDYLLRALGRVTAL